MKPSSLLSFAAFLSIGMVTPVPGQNLMDQELFPLTFKPFQKAEALVSDGIPLCVVKNSPCLDSRLNSPSEMGSIVDMDVLRQPSIYKAGSIKASLRSEEILAERLALLSATYRNSTRSVDGQDGFEAGLSAGQKIKINPSAVLEIVENEILTNPSFACEIVKAAILATEPEPSTVVGIVEKAIHSAPEATRLISQCAIATAPESLAAIQALLARLDPNGGDSGSHVASSKSAKSAKSTMSAVNRDSEESGKANPLDQLWLEPMAPGPILPPLVTNVDP